MKSKITVTVITILIFMGITWITQDDEKTNADLSVIGWPFTIHRYFSGKVFDPKTGMQDRSEIPDRSTFFISNLVLDIMVLLLLIVAANFLFNVYRQRMRKKRLTRGKV